MKPFARRLALVAALSVAGCAVNPPLMFGDVTTFGIRLGNDTATGGGSVSLGYKAQSIAVVPVSVLDDTGTPRLLRGHGQGYDELGEVTDAMSVFASFESDAGLPEVGGKVRLGQAFSTGMAAQELTMGYICREVGAIVCASWVQQLAEQAALRSKAPPSASRPSKTSEQAQAPDRTGRPYQSPLLFLRTDVVGIDLGGSLAEQGLQFVLGYRNRNLALIPVYAEGAGNAVVRIVGKSETDNGEDALDALSVLGQFRTNTSTAKLDLGLERYFATGVAARNLGTSLRTAIAKTAAPSEPVAANGTQSESQAASLVEQ